MVTASAKAMRMLPIPIRRVAARGGSPGHATRVMPPSSGNTSTNQASVVCTGQPFMDDISSTSRFMRLRNTATTRPSPITTSAAATTITTSAKICPAGSSH